MGNETSSDRCKVSINFQATYSNELYKRSFSSLNSAYSRGDNSCHTHSRAIIQMSAVSSMVLVDVALFGKTRIFIFRALIVLSVDHI